MKLASSNYSTILRRSSSGFCSQKWDLHYSTTATSKDSLFGRILPRARSRGLIGPVLDQWVEEGRDVQKRDLRYIVRELRRFDRFKAALEVSEWMSDKRSIKLSNRDMAARLDLISRLYGTEKAENYFNSIPLGCRDMETFGILLNCYARSNLVEKAEATVQKMKDLGFMTRTSSYNIMLNLYRQTGDKDKLKAVLSEMEEKGVGFDKFTFGTVLTAYANASDLAGMNKTLKLIESNPNAALDWTSYHIAANAFITAGDREKALAMLKKSEELVLAVKDGGNAYDSILSLYATLGRKDDVLRLWALRKEAEKPRNTSYIKVISELLKLEEMKTAEQIFQEWESSDLTYNIKVPNLLVRAYCRKGLMDKAKEFIDRAVAKGAIPDANTWYYMVLGYVNTNQMSKAVEAMKLAVSAKSKKGWEPTGCLAACSEYLKQKGDAEEAGEFLGSLLSNEIISAAVHDKLLFYVKNLKSAEDAPVENQSALEILKA